jgi:hypothetical protein
MYMYPLYKYNSYRAFIILFNGLVYHGLTYGNMKMLSIDLICNFLISFYTGYYYPKVFLKGAFCTLFFILNSALFYSNYINSITSQILHVITTHIPFLLMLIIHLKSEKMKNITN